jgi:hypothetical protein
LHGSTSGDNPRSIAPAADTLHKNMDDRHNPVSTQTAPAE